MGALVEDMGGEKKRGVGVGRVRKGADLGGKNPT